MIFLFLRRLSATIIPTLAVPISLIATLGAMYGLGFSIDNISLLGLTLSVGLVVDDAIVMLENIVRHIEEGMPPFEAALKGSGEVGFTIISITISLVAVFVPILLMGGVVGRIFNEFAVVVTISIIASSLISLTLTPMLCARLPRSRGEEHGFLFRVLLRVYRSGSRSSASRPDRSSSPSSSERSWPPSTCSQSTPKGFLPQEDIGQLSVSTEARQDISFHDMQALQQEVADTLRARTYVAHVASVVGGGFNTSTANQGSLFVELKPKNQRPALETILGDLRRTLGAIPGINSYVTPVQNLRIGGVSSKSQYQFVVQGIDRDELLLWANKLADAMGSDRALHRRHHRRPGERAPGDRRGGPGKSEPARHHRGPAAQFAL